ncbi:permease [Peribacillus frigoritolerans]
MGSKIGNLLIASFTLFIGVYIIFDTTITRNEDFPLIAVLILSVSIMFFSLTYLHSQFKLKDERMKIIREKSMFYTYFLLMAYFLLFVTLLSLNIISVTAIEIIFILASLTIITVFLLMVIISKII